MQVSRASDDLELEVHGNITIICANVAMEFTFAYMLGESCHIRASVVCIFMLLTNLYTLALKKMSTF